MNIDDLNYRNDHRNCEAAPMTIILFDGDDERELPGHWVVCRVCNGTGSHVNPSIDASGLDSEMFDDQGFMDGYRNGVYDVPCNRCTGRTTVWDVDPPANTMADLKAYARQLDDDASSDSEY
tara:strand:- start:741 stop:1106 length:366 start_codon:yes stop_codon:yes gene_type:complete